MDGQHDSWSGSSWVYSSQLTLHAVNQGLQCTRISYNYFVTGEDKLSRIRNFLFYYSGPNKQRTQKLQCSFTHFLPKDSVYIYSSPLMSPEQCGLSFRSHPNLHTAEQGFRNLHKFYAIIL